MIKVLAWASFGWNSFFFVGCTTLFTWTHQLESALLALLLLACVPTNALLLARAYDDLSEPEQAA
jgi:hypothetical protein